MEYFLFISSSKKTIPLDLPDQSIAKVTIKGIQDTKVLIVLWSIKKRKHFLVKVSKWMDFVHNAKNVLT